MPATRLQNFRTQDSWSGFQTIVNSGRKFRDQFPSKAGFVTSWLVEIVAKFGCYLLAISGR